MSDQHPLLRDESFLKNVREARENGYDLLCADCGVGLFDDSDEHDMFCPRNPAIDDNLETARRYAAELRR